MRQLTFEMLPSSLPLSASVTPQPAPAERGSLTEVILGEGSALQPFQLLPVLAHCREHQRWLMWLSANKSLNKEWLARAGLDKAPILHVATTEAQQLSVLIKALEAATSHVIMEWQGNLSRESRQTFRQLAEARGTHVILIRTDV